MEPGLTPHLPHVSAPVLEREGMWRDLQDLLLDDQVAFRVRGWTSVAPTSYHLQKKVTMTPLPKSILHIPSPWDTTIAVDLSLVGLVLECKAWGCQSPFAPSSWRGA